MGPWVHAFITLTSEESQQGSSTLISKRMEHSGAEIQRKRARTSQDRSGIELHSRRINLIYFLDREIYFNKSNAVRTELQWVLRFLSYDMCFCTARFFGSFSLELLLLPGERTGNMTKDCSLPWSCENDVMESVSVIQAASHSYRSFCNLYISLLSLLMNFIHPCWIKVTFEW